MKNRILNRRNASLPATLVLCGLWLGKMLPLGCLLCLNACQKPVPIDDIVQPPPVTTSDEKYAGVFAPLNGRWHGRFFVYVDERGQAETPVQPRNIDAALLQALPLRLDLTVDVTQEYISLTPYFQKVRITDTYVDEQGEKVTVVSEGVNKVQDGRLWCVVHKPDETVIHAGELVDAHTLIWQRRLKNPLKMEYFRETVSDSTYTIIGWGYYGRDDPRKSPHYWFQATYRKVSE